jgi:isopenicillin-N epimerase
MYSEYIRHWGLDTAISFLNHGSFGAAPKTVLAFQQSLRERMEAEPVRFLMSDLAPLYQDALHFLADFVDADSEDMVFVPNATHGVNAVMRSLALRPGDEILTTSHDYYAVRNTLQQVAQTHGCRVVAASVPFPLENQGQVIDTILSCVSERTRIALIDHVTSPTALIFPIEKIVQLLQDRGIEVLVDGAHAPGMLPLSIRKINAAYYTGNCHKWICAPKGAGFLWVRRDKQESVHAPITSYNRSSTFSLTPFQLEFFWSGTTDQTAWLSVGAALRFMGALLPGGWTELMQHNHDLAVKARQTLCQVLHLHAPCPDAMLGAMASLPVPANPNGRNTLPAFYLDELQKQLIENYQIQVPIMMWPRAPQRLLRISAQLYNHISQYEALAGALEDLCRAF